MYNNSQNFESQNYGAQNVGYTGGTGYMPPGAQGQNPYYYARMAKKNRKWPVAVIVICIVVAFALLTWGISSWLFDSELNNSVSSLPSYPYLALIDIAGEIGDYNDPYSSSETSYHHDWTLSSIRQAMNDSNNEGLILAVDSPGGSVYESDEIYNYIMEYKSTTSRPVYVYMKSMAASGGYYISAPADKIYANRNTWTGSIGVIVGTLFDISGFLEKHGIKAENITSAQNKDMGSYFSPLSEEQRAIYQSMVDEAYEQFVGIVAEGRNMSIEEVKKIADGRVLTAKQAMDAGLIDGIMDENSFYTQVRKDAGNENLEIYTMYYYARTNWFSSLFPSLVANQNNAASNDDNIDVSSDELTNSDIAAVLELAERGEGKVPLKYLYGG